MTIKYSKIKIFGLIIYLTSAMLIGMERSNGKFTAKVIGQQMCGTTPTWYYVSITDNSKTELKRVGSRAPITNLQWRGNTLYIESTTSKNSINMHEKSTEIKCR